MATKSVNIITKDIPIILKAFFMTMYTNVAFADLYLDTPNLNRKCIKIQHLVFIFLLIIHL